MYPLKEIIEIYIVFKEYEEFFNEIFNFASDMELIISLQKLIDEYLINYEGKLKY